MKKKNLKSALKVLLSVALLHAVNVIDAKSTKASDAVLVTMVDKGFKRVLQKQCTIDQVLAEIKAHDADNGQVIEYIVHFFHENPQYMMVQEDNKEEVKTALVAYLAEKMNMSVFSIGWSYRKMLQALFDGLDKNYTQEHFKDVISTRGTHTRPSALHNLSLEDTNKVMTSTVALTRP